MKFIRVVGIFVAVVLAGALAWPATAVGQVKVFNYEVLGDPYRVSNPGPVSAITITGTRNGSFSGAVAVSSRQAIAGLKARMGALSMEGGASIPADKVQVRYAVSWGTVGGGPASLDMLPETPPAAVAIDGEKKIALTGVWVTVTVPKDAKAGVYRGQLTVEATGLQAQNIPLELTVVDWSMPDPQDWRTWIEMIESPDTLAMEYNVPLWSEKHLAMIARSFQLIRQSGSRVVYIPLLRNTNQGNSEAMVQWIKQKDGTYKPDYSIMEKYLDVAQKNLGEIKMVVLYAWDVYLCTSWRDKSYAERPKTPGPEQKWWDLRHQGLLVTMRDEETGKTEPGNLPLYTAAGSKELWKPVYDELRKRLKARGLEKAMVLGMVTDMEPSKEDTAFLQDVSGGLSWVAHSHYWRLQNRAPVPNKLLAGIADVCYESHAYDLTYQVNTDKGHLYGWNKRDLSAFVDRFEELNGPALRIRQVTLINITGGQRGVGRLGGDYWDVLRNKQGQRAGRAFDRYPENSWPKLNVSSYFLAPGPTGPVATARLENLREGIEECEARIFIESTLLDPAKKQRLGDDLVARAQKALDDHLRALWQSYWSDANALQQMGTISGRDTYEAIWDGCAKAKISLPEFWSGPARKLRDDENRKGMDWFVGSDWQQRNKALYAAAAEVQQKLK